jgi:hypothetical protein
MKAGRLPLLAVPMPAVALGAISVAAMAVLVAEVAMMAIARGHAAANTHDLAMPPTMWR